MSKRKFDCDHDSTRRIRAFSTFDDETLRNVLNGIPSIIAHLSRGTIEFATGAKIFTFDFDSNGYRDTQKDYRDEPWFAVWFDWSATNIPVVELVEFVKALLGPKHVTITSSVEDGWLSITFKF